MGLTHHQRVVGKQRVLAHASRPFAAGFRAELLALNRSGPDELHRAALAANTLVQAYAATVADPLAAQNTAERLAAIDDELMLLLERWEVLEARTLAKLLDALDVQPGDLVLDLGCGLGYSTAVIARLAETVVAVEEDEALAADAQRILSEEGVDNAVVVTGKLTDGAAKCAPYDVITVEGGVEVMPDSVLAQLKDGGRIGAVFMDGAVGTARIGYRVDGRMTWRSVFNAAAPVLPGFRKAQGFTL